MVTFCQAKYETALKFKWISTTCTQSNCSAGKELLIDNPAVYKLSARHGVGIERAKTAVLYTNNQSIFSFIFLLFFLLFLSRKIMRIHLFGTIANMNAENLGVAFNII